MARSAGAAQRRGKSMILKLVAAGHAEADMMPDAA